MSIHFMASCPRAPWLKISCAKVSQHDIRKCQRPFSKDFSRWLHRAFDLRQRCDYEAQFNISPEDTQATLDAAEKFVAEVKFVIAAMMSRSEADH